MRSEVVLTVYEPRWHGHARWKLERWDEIAPGAGGYAFVFHLHGGFVRRRNGREFFRRVLPGRPSRTAAKHMAGTLHVDAIVEEAA